MWLPGPMDEAELKGTADLTMHNTSSPSHAPSLRQRPFMQLFEFIMERESGSVSASNP
jgi:hypothetical protein